MSTEKPVLPPTEGPLIYVVDADGPVRESFGMLLRTAGYRARTFGTADEFRNAWADGGDGKAPNCVIASIDLPDGDGRDLSRAISTENPGLPVVLMSRDRDEKLASTVSAFGACAFLIKPFLHSELFEILAQVLV